MTAAMVQSVPPDVVVQTLDEVKQSYLLYLCNEGTCFESRHRDAFLVLDELRDGFVELSSITDRECSPE